MKEVGLLKPWAITKESILEKLQVEQSCGLSSQEAEQRLEQYGHNKLRETKTISAWALWFEQFRSVVVSLLVVAAAAAFSFGHWLDGTAVVVVIVINAVIGFFTEFHAIRSMESLRAIGQVTVRLRRAQEVMECPAEELVPGDIVLLEAGEVITADIRLLEASRFQVNESTLTGESLPVDKQVEPLEARVVLAERSNMVFKGTAVTRGSGEGVVVKTGMATEIGHISALVDRAENDDTPLEKRLDRMGHKLVWITVVIAAVVTALGVWRQKGVVLMVETGIALAVAAIPEGLPIVATIALAQGMQRMAKRKALVNRLSAVETLGGTNVICTDKTGTLTENQMTVTEINLPSGPVVVSGEGTTTQGTLTQDDQELELNQQPLLHKALQVGMLCNNASLSGSDENQCIGDPMEIALLVVGTKAGLSHREILENQPKQNEEAFDSDSKMMATFHKSEGGTFQVAVKGAPEAVFPQCTSWMDQDGNAQELNDERREELAKQDKKMAKAGLRVLGLATKQVSSLEEEPYEGLTFLGLFGFIDPPRKDVCSAIQSCKDAGIRIVMVTGDQAITARQVALAVGLIDEEKKHTVLHGADLKPIDECSEEEYKQFHEASILARVSPKQKLDLIDIHQREGAIVAMTGDGVNDAPALKKADIGIAMGQRGTDVAKEAADMVLQDDAFDSIVAAVEQGRVIFNNIRKFVLFLHSGNGCKILTVGLASALNTPLPILPLQILFLNVITDVFPALALGVSPGTSEVMKQPPRNPKEPIITPQHWWAIAAYGLLITIATLGALGIAKRWLQMPHQQAITISFLTLAFAQLWHVFNMRAKSSHFWRNEITTNPFIWGALILCTLLLLSAVYFPPLAQVLQVTNPGTQGWLLIGGMSLIPVTVGQLWKVFQARHLSSKD